MLELYLQQYDALADAIAKIDKQVDAAIQVVVIAAQGVREGCRR
jgi:hypothetical protein